MVYYGNIKRHIFDLAENPRPQGYRKLEGFADLYRIRVGKYRVVYSIEDKILRVEVINVDHRKDVYKSL
jgi:mRNA interferase RelE/StbE